ncbi:MAG: DUF721 domain-containing protein [Actinobacteria bacterium]|nr:DUF721 domain-containing protein [Actinomycetota bacterium]
MTAMHDEQPPRKAAEPTKSSTAAGSACQEFKRLGDLLGDLAVLQHGVDTFGGSQDVRRRLALLWAEAVGPEIAANAEPIHLKQGRLVVATSSSAWAQTLQLMAEQIKARLSTLLLGAEVTSLVFRHAGWQGGGAGACGLSAALAAGEKAPTATPNGIARGTLQGKARGALSGTADESAGDDGFAAIREVEGLDLDPRLKAKITQAMRASFVREEQDIGC